MEQHEKEIMDRIRQHIENIEIPEQLRPEVVEEQLMRHQKRYRKKAYRYALTAAACLGLLGIGNGKSVKCTCTTSDLIEDQKTLCSSITENI